MPIRLSAASIASILTLAIGANSALAVDAYLIGDGGASLLKFDTASPGTITKIADFSGGSPTFGPFLDTIDFRPATGQLFGYLDASDEVFTVNTTTAVLTKHSAAAIGATTDTFFVGMDFNPMIDRLRIVTDSALNNVYNPTTGTATAATNLAYATGDVNAGTVPAIIDNAYSNNRAGAVTTVQYALDYELNALVTLANNTGVLTTVAPVNVGGVPLDFDSFAGFDIYTDGNGVNTAFAFLNVGGVDGFYTINFGSGAATLIAPAGTAAFGDVYSLAVAVPEPTSILALTAGAALLGVRRKR